MKVAKKNLCTAFALVITLAFLFLHVPDVYPTELSVEEKAISIITDVAKLDMTKYNLNLSNHTFDQYGGKPKEYLKYTLESNGNKLQVYFTFINKTLTNYALYQVDGSDFSPLYAQPLPASSLDVAKSFLQRYQIFSNTLTVQEARNILDTVTEVKTMNATVGNLKMRIIVMDNNSTHIEWKRVINGLEFWTGLSIRIRNGVLDHFNDESSFYRIGSADVKISQEEAIRIAWEEAKTYTSLKIWMGDTYEIIPFSLKEEPTTVRLQINTRDMEPFTMYPFWYIRFGAEKIQYGVNGVEVGVWADTGEVPYSHLTGYFGTISETENPTDTTPDSSSPEPDTENSTDSTSGSQTSPEFQLESNTNPPLTAYLIVATAATTIAVAVAAVALKKRSK